MFVHRDSPWINEVTPYFEKLERIFNANLIFLGIGILSCLFVPFVYIRILLFLIVLVLILYSPQLSQIIFKVAVARHSAEVDILCQTIPVETTKAERSEIMKIFDPEVPTLQIIAMKILFITLFIGLVVIAGRLNRTMVDLLLQLNLSQLVNIKPFGHHPYQILIITSIISMSISTTLLIWHFLCKPNIFPISMSAIMTNENLGIFGKIRQFIWGLLGLIIFIFGICIGLYLSIQLSMAKDMSFGVTSHNIISIFALIRIWFMLYVAFIFLAISFSFSCVAKIVFDYVQFIIMSFLKLRSV